MKKNWKVPFYQSESLRGLLERILEELHPFSSALTLIEGKALHVRALHPADTATLSMASMQCHHYARLKDGEIGICNDPYSGGTRLSEVTLVMGVACESTNQAVDMLIACRIPFPARFSLRGKLDEEGVRIPPMPLGTASNLNREILAAIGSAPLAPRGFAAAVEAAVEPLERVRMILKKCARDPLSEFKKGNFKGYLQDCKDMLLEQISRLPLGETTLTTHLESGELLKLKLDISDSRLVFDFTGTETTSRLQLTDLMTYGACFAALSAALEKGIPANAGTFQLVEAISPSRSWVNAKSPAATALGASDGIATVASLVMKALGRLSPAYHAGVSGHGAHHVQLEFTDGRVFTDTTPGGTGAAKKSPGADGVSLWLGGHETESLSVESTERDYPVQVRSIANRTNSGGKGKWPGGLGILKSYTLTAPARLSWALQQANHKPEGIAGGKAGATAEIAVFRKNSDEKEKLPAEGQLDLQAGDTIRILSAGGGGYGEPESPPVS